MLFIPMQILYHTDHCAEQSCSDLPIKTREKIVETSIPAIRYILNSYTVNEEEYEITVPEYFYMCTSVQLRWVVDSDENIEWYKDYIKNCFGSIQMPEEHELFMESDNMLQVVSQSTAPVETCTMNIVSSEPNHFDHQRALILDSNLIPGGLLWANDVKPSWWDQVNEVVN